MSGMGIQLREARERMRLIDERSIRHVHHGCRHEAIADALPAVSNGHGVRPGDEPEPAEQGSTDHDA